MNLNYLPDKHHFQGIWFQQHLLAFNVKTVEDGKQFVKQFLWIIRNLPCPSCTRHSIEYLRSHPIDSCIRMTSVRDNFHVSELFYYIYKFHNDVNKTLGKREPSYSNICETYKNLTDDRKTNQRVRGNQSRRRYNSRCMNCGFQ